MAKGLSLAVHEAVLNCYFNAANITAPATLYTSLHTADPGDDGQIANEVVGNGYNRIFTDSVGTPIAWTAAAEAGAGTSIMEVENVNTVTYDQASGGSWGTITHVGVWIHLTGTSAAQFIGRGALGTPRAVPDGDTPYFPAAAFKIQITQTA